MHVPGINNDLAEASSCNNLPFFFAHYPQAAPSPSLIPPALLDHLVLSTPDRTLHRNTMHSYTSSHQRYINFCSVTGSDTYPTTESFLCQFAGYLGKQGLKHQTIKCYLSGIRYCFIIPRSFEECFAWYLI